MIFGFDTIGCAVVKLSKFSSGKDICVCSIIQQHIIGELIYIECNEPKCILFRRLSCAFWWLSALTVCQEKDKCMITCMLILWNEIIMNWIYAFHPKKQDSTDFVDHYHHYPSFTSHTEDDSSSSILGLHCKAEEVVQ